MAHLLKVKLTRYVIDGKRVAKDTPGAVIRREQSTKWYCAGVPGYPSTKRFPLSADKRVAERLMGDLVRGAEQGFAGVPDQNAARKALHDHLTAFELDVSLGLATRSHKKRVPSLKQVALTVQRVRDALTACRMLWVADLGGAAPAKLARHLQSRVASGDTSHQTASFVLAGMRRFVWWLSARANAPVRADLFDHLPGFDPRANRVHERRAGTADEIAALLAAARAGKVYCRLRGEDRYFLYLTAFSTGFRSDELARLTPQHFELNGADGPRVRLRARDTKSNRDADQPLPLGVAEQLRGYLAGRTPLKSVWPGSWSRKGARMLRFDLAAAGVAYSVETPTGEKFLDFHALRHSFITALANAGVQPRELQELARHTSPGMTLGVYTHSTPGRLAESVNLLEAIEPGRTELERLTKEQLIALVGLLAVTLGHVIGCVSGCVRAGLGGTPTDSK